ncbi:odorant receptor 131-2-like [Dendropsophus ebraccatus]|uniref:odorant receptor 131-2-like n=1 Tax=Dendropsophus ebraccatus TaxID=150705 RepID=UPI0038311B7D
MGKFSGCSYVTADFLHSVMNVSSPMVNSSFSESNRTQLSIYSQITIEIVRTSLIILVFIGFFSFLYFMKILLSVYFTTEHIRDNSRYILFAHMLITDTVCLLMCLLLMVCAIYVLYLPFFICYIIVAGISTSFVVTPYNLAVMSLERYVAICFPLRHMEICSVHNTSIVISIMWFLGFIPVLANIIAMSSAVQKEIFSVKVKCNYFAVTMTSVQETINSVHILLSLIMVGVILVFTYIKVLLVAKKCGSSAFKASKTVLLHGFQVLLCMTSLTTSFLELSFKDYVLLLRAIFFLVFMCLPRFLSPLIYGLRDEVFWKYIQKIYMKPLIAAA